MNNNSPMILALQEAERAAARGEVPVGAVLVDGNSGAILAQAGNRTEADNDPTAHAEIRVIRAAAAQAGAPRLPEADLYVTLEPCSMCAAAISFASAAGEMPSLAATVSADCGTWRMLRPS